MTKLVPLYDVPRKTWVKCQDQIFFFDHIDGMYSYCEDQNGNVIHPAAFTEVEIIDASEDSDGNPSLSLE